MPNRDKSSGSSGPELRTVFLADRCSPDAKELLRNQPFLRVLDGSSFSEVSSIDFSEVHAVLLRTQTHITAEFLERMPKLQLVVTATSGFDHIDLSACREWGITVMHTPLANRESTSQLTWALLLACCHRLLEAQRQMQTGVWARDALKGIELQNKTLGIVGLGRIGKRVAQMGQAFGMRVLCFDPYIDDKESDALDVERVNYDELLSTSHVLSFHVPRTAETRMMFNETHLPLLQHSPIVINACRGGVVSEKALLHGLQNGAISACGLDVYSEEPLPIDSALLTHPRVVLTPHLGANTEEAFEKASDEAARKVIRYFVDGSTSDTLPPKAAWYIAQAEDKSK